MATLDPDNLQKLRVVDLKEILSRRNLSTSGLKADLVKRLREALLEEKPEEETEELSFAEDVDENTYNYDQQDASFPQFDEKQVKVDRVKVKSDMKLENIQKNLAEEAQRRADEEKEIQKRKAEELEKQKILEQQRVLEEQEQQRIAHELEMQRLHEEEVLKQQMEEEKKIILAKEQERLLAEEKTRLMAEEQNRLLAEEQKRLLIEEQERLFEHEQKIILAEQKRLLAEEQKRLLAEEQKRLLAEEQKRLLAEEQKRLAEEQQRLLAEEQKRLLAQEQQRLLAEEQKRLLAQEQQRLLAEEQKRLLAEEQKRLAEEQQRLLAEEQKRLLAEEQKRILAEQQKLFITEKKVIAEQQKKLEKQFFSDGDKEKEILQQNANSGIVELHIPPAIAPPRKMKDSNIDQNDEIKLPSAVEKILTLKSERAQELGVDPDSVIELAIEPPGTENIARKLTSRVLVSVDEMDDDDMEEQVKSKSKESRNRRRKKKKKKRPAVVVKKEKSKVKETTKSSKTNDIDIEYVQDVLDVTEPMYVHFINIFEMFKLTDPSKDNINDVSMEEIRHEIKLTDRKIPRDIGDDDDDDKDERKEEEKPKLSKRKLKKLSRMSVAELKQKVIRPELVEMHDVTAKDPVLLLHLKASRNTVPVPRHWCFKRKYLQGKRGIEKPAFELPDFIKRTGIMEMRQALQEKEDQKTMKAKMRERVRPKLGKIDIDYQKLHDAFFKWQTKPKMTIHGDLYYEGKEFETRLKEKKPGDLNDDLRVALGMPTGPNANKCPPPWLIAMQRYGPPPSYPNLKIPGLNAPIPDSCSFGYHAGGWGKPPVDEMGRPLYGDVFGTQNADNLPHLPEEEIDHTLWGELESESSEEEEDEDEEEEEEEEQKGEDDTGLVTPAEGLITPSGFSSIPAGMETPDMIELRKRKIEAEMEGGETPALYTILPEKKTERVGAAMMGSTHIYDLSAAIPAAAKTKVAGTTSVAPQGIEVALDPSELEMDSAAMAARYEQTLREQQSQLAKEDLSDMVAEHAARQKTKRKKQQQDSSKAPKKYKEFKF